jgi:hypothetical protein
MSAPRYELRERTSQTSKIREPWQVIDTADYSIVDEYASKRAATAHVRELNDGHFHFGSDERQDGIDCDECRS